MIGAGSSAMIGIVGYHGLTALTLILVARRVGQFDYGQYLSTFGLSAFLVVIADFGTQSWLLTQADSVDRIASTVRRTLYLRLWLLFAWLGAMLGLSWFLPANTFPYPLMVVVLFGVTCDSFALLAFAALRATQRHTHVMILQIGAALLLLIVTWFMPLAPGDILRFAGVRSSVALILSVVLLVQTLRLYRSQHVIAQSMRQIMTQSRPFFWAELASSFYAKVDLLLVSLILGAVAAGIYGPAINILVLFFLVPRAWFLLIVPLLSQIYRRKPGQFIIASGVQTLFMACVGVAATVCIWIFAPLLVQWVFGSAYQESALILQYLSPIPLLRSLNVAIGAVLASSGQQARRTRIQIMAAMVNLLGNLIVIFPFGLVGVALTYILSEALLLVGYVRLLQRSVRLSTSVV